MSFPLIWRKALWRSSLAHLVFFLLIGLLLPHIPTFDKQADTFVELAVADLSTKPLDEITTQTEATQKEPNTNTSPIANAAFAAPATPQMPSNINSSTASPAAATVASGTLAVTGAALGPAPENAGTTGKSDSPAKKSVSVSDIIPPAILYQSQAPYPSSSRQAGEEGTVLVKVQILPSGYPGEITLSRSSGYDALDAAALTAIKNWRFSPARNPVDNSPITCTTRIPISFQLHT